MRKNRKTAFPVLMELGYGMHSIKLSIDYGSIKYNKGLNYEVELSKRFKDSEKFRPISACRIRTC